MSRAPTDLKGPGFTLASFWSGGSMESFRSPAPGPLYPSGSSAKWDVDEQSEYQLVSLGCSKLQLWASGISPEWDRHSNCFLISRQPLQAALGIGWNFTAASVARRVPISHFAHLNPLALQGAETTQISNSPLHLPEGLPFQCVLSHISHVQLCATLWTVARQAPLSMGFSR